jgi:tetratricopeptide (TPR) repeat protein
MSCQVCAAPNAFKCKCQLANYCGPVCQKAHRKEHRKECEAVLNKKPCVVCAEKTNEMKLCSGHVAHSMCAAKLKEFKLNCPECVDKKSPEGKYTAASLLFIKFLDKTDGWIAFNEQGSIPPARKLTDILHLYEGNAYPLALCMLGRMHQYGLGVLENASKAMEYFFAAGEFSHAKYGLGVIYSELKDYTNALSYYTKAIELEELYDAYLHRGSVRMAMHDSVGAQLDYAKVLELNPTDARAHSNMGIWHLTHFLPPATGQLKAMDYFRKAIELEPELTIASTNLAKLYMIHGDDVSAEKCLRSTGPPSVASLTSLAALLLHRYTSTHKQDKELLMEARMLVMHAAKLNPSTPEPYCCLADIHIAEGQPELAIALHRNILKNWADYSTIINLAVCLSTAVFTTEVVQLYQRAIMLVPDNLDAYGMLAVYFMNHSEYGEAREVLELALEVDPDHPDILSYYAAVRIFLNPDETAQWVKNYHRALELNPGNTIANCQLSKLEKDPELAIHYLSESIKTDAYNCEKLTRLGMLYFINANGDIDKLLAALEQLRKAQSVSPDDEKVHTLIGDCYFSIGAYHEARGDTRKAIAAFLQVNKAALTFAVASEKIQQFKQTGQ